MMRVVVTEWATLKFKLGHCLGAEPRRVSCQNVPSSPRGTLPEDGPSSCPAGAVFWLGAEGCRCNATSPRLIKFFSDETCKS